MDSKEILELAKSANLGISAYDWVKQRGNIKESYCESYNRDYSSQFGQMFRDEVYDFDKAINPFLNYDLEINEDCDYLKENNFFIDNSDEMHCIFETCNPLNGDCAIYERAYDGFKIQLQYSLGYEKYLDVTHELSSKTNNEEIFTIQYYGDEMKVPESIEYNMTNGSFSIDGKPVTMDDIVYIYGEIEVATKLASTLTTDKINKNSISKKLKPTKKRTN